MSYQKYSRTFWHNVLTTKTVGCWYWQGSVFPKTGYGRWFENNKAVRAHRKAWQIWYGDPGKLFVCHTCDTPLCVRPSHLFLGTAIDNMQDAAKKHRMKGRSHWTHCINGHAFTPKNIYWFKSKTRGKRRQCRTCTLARQVRS